MGPGAARKPLAPQSRRGVGTTWVATLPVLPEDASKVAVRRVTSAVATLCGVGEVGRDPGRRAGPSRAGPGRWPHGCVPSCARLWAAPSGGLGSLPARGCSAPGCCGRTGAGGSAGWPGASCSRRRALRSLAALRQEPPCRRAGAALEGREMHLLSLCPFFLLFSFFSPPPPLFFFPYLSLSPHPSPPLPTPPPALPRFSLSPFGSTYVLLLLSFPFLLIFLVLCFSRGSACREPGAGCCSQGRVLACWLGVKAAGGSGHT